MTDLSGKTFNRWRVIKKDKNKNGYWICKCSCGTIRSVYGENLKLGKSKSCGCIQRDDIKRALKISREKEIGKKYGKLTVVGYYLDDNSKYVDVICDCGNRRKVMLINLKSGKTTSCGCEMIKARSRRMGDKEIEALHKARDNSLVDGIGVSNIFGDPPKNNTSGVKGVSYNKKLKKWRAYIGARGVRYELGIYSNIEDAIKARKEAENDIQKIIDKYKGDE